MKLSEDRAPCRALLLAMMNLSVHFRKNLGRNTSSLEVS